jgi:hypothetical protein
MRSSNPLKKIKKLLAENFCTQYCNKSQNLIFLSLFRPITFWGTLFPIFFCGFEISIKLCVFDTHIEFIKNMGIKNRSKN